MSVQWERRSVARGCPLCRSVAPNSHLDGLCQCLSERLHRFQVCREEVCQEEPCCSGIPPPRSREAQGHTVFAPSICREHGLEQARAGPSAGTATPPQDKQLLLSSLSVRAPVSARGQSFGMKKVLSVSQEKQAGSSRARSIMAEGGFLAVAPQPSWCCVRGGHGSEPQAQGFPKATL